MGKLDTHSTPGFNAGKTFLSKMVRISDIVIDPEIASIFDISEKTLEKITWRIKTFGFFREEPVVIWKGTSILVDGRTRYTAAKNAELEEIPAVEKEFESKEAAIRYTIERQVLRRNLTGAEILKVAKLLPEERNRKGEGSAARQLAEETGVSESTIYKANKILKEGSPEVVEKVQSGEMSIKDGYQETAVKKPLPKAEVPAKYKAADTSFHSLSRKVLTAYSKIEDAYAYIESNVSDLTQVIPALDLLRDSKECLKSVEKELTILE